jgi:uncharacterized membrane protein
MHVFFYFFLQIRIHTLALTGIAGYASAYLAYPAAPPLALGVVVAASILDGEGVAPEPLDGILLRVILGDPQRFELVGEEQVAKPR